MHVLMKTRPRRVGAAVAMMVLLIGAAPSFASLVITGYKTRNEATVSPSAKAYYSDHHDGAAVYDPIGDKYTAQMLDDGSLHGTHAFAEAGAAMVGFDPDGSEEARSTMGTTVRAQFLDPAGGGPTPSPFYGAEIRITSNGEADAVVGTRSVSDGEGTVSGQLEVADDDLPPFSTVDIYFRITADNGGWSLLMPNATYQQTGAGVWDGTAQMLVDVPRGFKFTYHDSILCGPGEVVNVENIAKIEFSNAPIPEPGSLLALAVCAWAMVRRTR